MKTDHLTIREMFLRARDKQPVRDALTDIARQTGDPIPYLVMVLQSFGFLRG